MFMILNKLLCVLAAEQLTSMASAQNVVHLNFEQHQLRNVHMYFQVKAFWTQSFMLPAQHQVNRLLQHGQLHGAGLQLRYATRVVHQRADRN